MYENITVYLMNMSVKQKLQQSLIYKHRWNYDWLFQLNEPINCLLCLKAKTNIVHKHGIKVVNKIQVNPVLYI